MSSWRTLWSIVCCYIDYTSVVGGLEWFQLPSSNSTRVSRLRTYQQLNVQLRMTPGVEDMAVLLIRWHPLIESSWVAE